MDKHENPPKRWLWKVTQEIDDETTDQVNVSEKAEAVTVDVLRNHEIYTTTVLFYHDVSLE